MTSGSFSLTALLAQFRARYPSGAIITELLALQQGIYAIRALVQMGGMTVATGMAAAEDIEQAEDRAKVRALDAFGLLSSLPSALASLPSPISHSAGLSTELNTYSANPYHETYHDATYSEISNTAVPSPAFPLTQSSSNSILAEAGVPTPPSAPEGRSDPWRETEAIAPLPGTAAPEKAPSPHLPLTTPVQPNPGRAVIADLYTHINLDTSADPGSTLPPSLTTLPEEYAGVDSMALPSIDKEPPAASTPATPPVAKPNRSKGTASLTESPAIAPSQDLSDVIAQIGTEMMRLNWTTAQGKEHLKRTYGKRSRSELNEMELYDFLTYLQAQP